MIKRKAEQQIVQNENMRGGNLTVSVARFLEPDDVYDKGRMFATVTIPPGGSIGEHPHVGEFEIYHILSGTARVTDNGELCTMEAGDTMVCRDGDSHSIENAGGDDLVFLALVLNNK